MKALRSEEYFRFEKPCKFLKFWFFRKKNIQGAKLGFFIPAGCFAEDLKISHYGSIIVNPHARIGKGCTIHGNCCIGNKGLEPYDNDSPIIGENVNIGQGAQILGPIKIADDTTIAAGAVVVKSVEERGKTVAGIPACYKESIPSNIESLFAI
ncbi:MAG: serine acetyltransferase [Bacteroidales bacterium]|nr:serine acetyltransferase [Bacteroidales bacterium]